jgi:hypothetical protein
MAGILQTLGQDLNTANNVAWDVDRSALLPWIGEGIQPSPINPVPVGQAKSSTATKKPRVKGAGKSRAGGNRPGTAATRQPAGSSVKNSPYDHPKKDANGNPVPMQPTPVGPQQGNTAPTPSSQTGGLVHHLTSPQTQQALVKGTPDPNAGLKGYKTPDYGGIPGDVGATFDLNSALASYLSPYINQSQQAGQAQQKQGIGQYLTNVPSNIAQTLQQGNQQLTADDQGMAGALKTAAADAGSAGFLTDLLNAAKYQAIYKQSLYGAPPPPGSLSGQLYDRVVAGGNALGGASSGLTFPGQTTTPGSTSTSSTPPKI